VKGEGITSPFPYRFEKGAYRFEKIGFGFVLGLFQVQYRFETFLKFRWYNDMNEALYFFNLRAVMHEKNPFTHEETAKLWVEYWAKK